MSNLVTTNIRLPAEDLKEYRMYALSQGKSFSALVREVLEKVISVGVITGARAKVVRKERTKEPAIFNVAKYKKWASGHKHDARDHDKIIYGF